MPDQPGQPEATDAAPEPLPVAILMRKARLTGQSRPSPELLRAADERTLADPIWRQP